MGTGSWLHDVFVWIKRKGDRKFGGQGMNLVFKSGMAAKMLMATTDAECHLKLKSVDKNTAILQLIVTVDGEEVMLADTDTTLHVGDTVEVPGVKVDIRVS